MATTITRWDPFAELADLRARLDRGFGDLTERSQRWTPAVDVVRDGDALVLKADVPGIQPEDINIELEDNVLTVSGEHTEEQETNEEDYVRRERRTGSFMRSMTLPAGVDAQSITAETKHGVLEVRIPLPSQPQKETIEVTSAG